MFDLRTELYSEFVKRIPNGGHQIIACQGETSIVVYQAYKSSIAKFAVANQYFGGPEFSLNRMSWIKPNFLWMMYRSGWAEKDGQEAILAITLRKTFFLEILRESVISSFNPVYHNSLEEWKNELDLKEVRLQWDPDHDAFGAKLKRRAIQLGLSGSVLARFAKTEILSIEDISTFVKAQKQIINSVQMEKLTIPFETVLAIEDIELRKRIGISAV